MFGGGQVCRRVVHDDAGTTRVNVGSRECVGAITCVPLDRADQLCRMSMMGIKTGPTAPGFCPSDAGESSEAEVRHRLEEQVAALRLELRSLKAA